MASSSDVSRPDGDATVMAQNIYDDPDFFAGYSTLPRARNGLDGAPEWPMLRDMLGDVSGARVLDLGCGAGAFARWAAGAGARHVLGIDLSQRMLERARALTAAPNVEYRCADLESLALTEDTFDIVYSSLSFHYIADLARLIAAIRHGLVDSGRLVFSVEHPLFTAPSEPRWITSNGATVWPLNNYTAEGRRITHWFAPGVVKYHRTLASHLNALIRAGFSVERIEEWTPTNEQIMAHPEWVNELHRPPFLLLAAR
jgi:SAM-dependent methyltransferase